MKSQNKISKKIGLVLLAALCLPAVLCSTGCQGKLEHTVAAAEAKQQLTFTARANDEAALKRILGPDSKAILGSGDTEEDKAALASFVAKYDRMNRWVTMTDGSRVLYIGADNYPYPIPLVQNESSSCYFNTEASKDETCPPDWQE